MVGEVGVEVLQGVQINGCFEGFAPVHFFASFTCAWVFHVVLGKGSKYGSTDSVLAVRPHGASYYVLSITKNAFN